MTTDYDAIAEKYQRAKRQPWRTHIEAFTLLGLLGDLRGKAVVDLACGEGYYTRLLRQLGADPVLGIDLSEGMIELARRQEADRPLGIEYRVGDGRCLDLPPVYDLAVAAYLLNYAASREELAAMCCGIAGCLKPSGRFITANTTPGLDFRSTPSYRSYGMEARLVGEPREGAPILWTFWLEDGPIEVENYFLDVAAHEEALRDAGFCEVRWHQPRLSAAGAADFGRDFWATFLEHPPVIFLECRK